MVERRSHRQGAITFMLAGDEEGDSEVSKLEAALEIDLKHVDMELAVQPALYYRARLMMARLEVQVMVADAEAVVALERVAAYLREQAADRPIQPTDAQIVARARPHVDVERPERRAMELRRRLTMARALEAAYAQRERVLAVLGAMVAVDCA